jgi:putative beta-lysine N-acetyltransferase
VARPSIELPSPTDPTPRWQPIQLRLSDGATVAAKDDPFSDRIRCDHPLACTPESLGHALIEAARQRDRGRVMLLARAGMRPGLEACGMLREATMPRFYDGREDCDVFGYAIDPSRSQLAEPEAVSEVDKLIARAIPARERSRPPTERATSAAAEAIAALVADTFEHYPTPTGNTAYVAEQIASGIPFRVVRDSGDVVACASADLVRGACTAELTDCATRPDQRGGGLMQALLGDLMDDLRQLRYPTAFTLARASVAGVNLAFQRLGFTCRGQMTRSCRIGGGIEDMNVWSRAL